MRHLSLETATRGREYSSLRESLGERYGEWALRRFQLRQIEREQHRAALDVAEEDFAQRAGGCGSMAQREAALRRLERDVARDQATGRLSPR